MVRNSEVISHWQTFFEDFSTSTQDFYRAIEVAIGQRGLPGVRLSRVLFSEGGVGSAKREYLRVEYRRVAFDICSAPYGKGHFFSWWLAKIPARFGILSVFLLVTLLLPVWMLLSTIFVRSFRGSCLEIILSGIVVILLFLGILVDRGVIGDVEWVLGLPILGYLYLVIFNPITYYRLDTAMMFRDAVRTVVNEVIKGLREERGLRALSAEELVPDRPGQSAKG